MKKVTIFLMLILSGICLGQKGINYKALIKNNSGNVISNQAITLQFTILQSVDGSLEFVYQETHNPTTDSNGIVIVSIGQGTTSYFFSSINWNLYDHFLNVQLDIGSGFVDLGTTQFMAVPYALNVNGLEKNGDRGWSLIGRDLNNYGLIGSDAVDLSYSNTVSDTYGATGNFSTTLGYETTASGFASTAMGLRTEATGENSIAMGWNSIASGENSTAMGNGTTASGNRSTAMGVGTTASNNNTTAMGNGTVASGINATALGVGTIADDFSSLAVGIYNDYTLASNTLFQIGNGLDPSTLSNAFVVDDNGVVTAPSFDISEITDPKALITKEYADANYLGGSGTEPTGLEALDEGNGVGWRIIGRNPDYYGLIGNGAIDFSKSSILNGNFGATGDLSVSLGNLTTASGLFSTSMGSGTTASGVASTAIGIGTVADDAYSTVIGSFNDNTISNNVLFQIGNGTNQTNLSNAFVVENSGVITAPSFDISEITDSKALITKEYADANYLGGTGTAPSGLEALDEGEGIGWRLIGSNPANYGTIGEKAIDLSISDEVSSVNGATGSLSIALGLNAKASSLFSIAIGTNASAESFGSIAIGGTSTGGGAIAIAGGSASGDNSLAFGVDCVSSGTSSISLGNNAEASGVFAVAMGNGSLAEGWNTFAAGINSRALGDQSVAVGAGVVASGHSSVAFGNNTIAEAPNTTVVGLFNVGGGNPLLASPSDPLFEVGNGNYVDGINDVRTNAFTVYRNGNATLGGTLSQNSDRRLKQDIYDLDYGLNEVLKLKPVSYHWKKYPDHTKSLGLIAQEVQPIIHEIVKQAEDQEKTLSVSYIELVPVLIKAIQEQQDIINKQDEKINGLTAELGELQSLGQRVKQLENLLNNQP